MKTMLRKAAATLTLFLAAFPFAAGALTVPVMVGQTGASSSFGRGELQGYTLAAEEWNAKGGVNGERVELLVEDTRTDQLNIVSAFQRLALRSFPVILGPTWLDGFQAVIPRAREKGILLVTPSAAVEAFSPENASWPVSFYHNSTEEARVLAEALAKEHGRLAVFYEQEPFAEMMLELLRKHWKKPLATFGAQAGESDFRAPVARMNKEGADGALILVWNERGLLSLLQQLATQAKGVPLATVHDGEGWLKHELFRPYLPRLLHTRFVVADRSFVERYKARFGEEPILTASNAYDALNNVLEAFAEGAKTAAAVKAFLMSRELKTATFGVTRFDARGQMQSTIAMVDFKR